MITQTYSIHGRTKQSGEWVSVCERVRVCVQVWFYVRGSPGKHKHRHQLNLRQRPRSYTSLITLPRRKQAASNRLHSPHINLTRCNPPTMEPGTHTYTAHRCGFTLKPLSFVLKCAGQVVSLGPMRIQHQGKLPKLILANISSQHGKC